MQISLILFEKIWLLFKIIFFHLQKVHFLKFYAQGHLWGRKQQ